MEAPMVTVEADVVGVESRLAGVGSDARHAGMGCCGWGYAGSAGRGTGRSAAARRARCRACLVTHVLLPVTVLLRRAYAAER
ncbi:hypothetical protein I552_4319, partial [Mycobacterium xenopi 3993]